MRDLIIGCSTNYDWSKLKYWINSINQSGFEGDKVLFLMNCDKETVVKVADAGFKVVGFGQNDNGDLVYNSRLAVHVERFLHIYDYLSDKDYRFVITTDVKDVVFQKNPVEYLEKVLLNSGKQCIFSSESMLYEDEPWGNQNLLETYGPYIHNKFKDKEIYNVGVLAGRGHAIRDLCINIFTAAINRPIPICDQSTFNFMVSMEPYKSSNLYLRSENGWACQLGTTADPSKVNEFRPKLLDPSPIMVDGNIATSTGEVFTIAHQYDRISQWKETIEKKYG
jgi:hypothetical protein